MVLKSLFSLVPPLIDCIMPHLPIVPSVQTLICPSAPSAHHAHRAPSVLTLIHRSVPVLLSLACGKVRVLRKEPESRNIGDADVFHYVPTFREKLFRIKINQACVRSVV